MSIDPAYPIAPPVRASRGSIGAMLDANNAKTLTGTADEMAKTVMADLTPPARSEADWTPSNALPGDRFEFRDGDEWEERFINKRGDVVNKSGKTQCSSANRSHIYDDSKRIRKIRLAPQPPEKAK
jgi:hypothetical protein